MILDKYFEDIESLAFQIQFSVLSGLSIVEFALSNNGTVNDLLDLIKNDTDLAERLYFRIRFLLPRVSQQTNLSYDESIVAYLYCLHKTDLLFAYRASALIWITETEGLLWSRWLAFKIMEFVHQVEESLDVSSENGVSGKSRFAEQSQYADFRSPATITEFSLDTNQDGLASYAFEFSTAI